MKKMIMLFFTLMSLAVNAQDEEARHLFYVGLNGGVDYDFNAYRQTPDKNGFDFYAINPHYNFGVDVGFMATKRLRPRLDFKFVKMSYGMDWGDFNGKFDKSITKLSNLDINLHLDWELLTRKKFQVFISPVLKSEFVSGVKYERHDKDGNTEEVNYNLIDDQFPKSILGGGLSAILKYNLTDHIGITMVPEYSIFCRRFVRSNDKNYQRFSTNIGIEFKF
jgi:hypothetical protein